MIKSLTIKNALQNLLIVAIGIIFAQFMFSIQVFYLQVILALVFVVFLIVIPLKTCFYIVCFLAAFNFSYTLFSGLKSDAAPMILKALKDVIFFSLALNWISKGLLSGEFRIRSSVGYLLIVFFAVYIFLRNIYYVDDFYVFWKIIRYLVVFPFVAMIVSGIFRKRQDLIKFINYIIILSFMVAVIGIVQLFIPGWDTAYGSASYFMGDNFGRAISTLGNPNNLAGFLLPSLIILGSLILGSEKERRQYRIYSLAFLVSFAAFILTFSRGRIIVALIVFLILSFYLKRKRISLMFSSLFLLGGAFSVFSRYAGIIGVINNPRFMTWSEFLNNTFFASGLFFLFGDGVGMANSNLGDPELLSALYVSSINLDNFYLNLLYFGGILAFFLFVAFLIYIFIVFSKRQKCFKNDGYISTLNIAIFFVIVSYLLGGLFGPNILTFPNSFFFWVFVGIFFNLERKSLRDE